MKRLIYILISGWFILGLASCDQDIDFPYQGKDRIQFQHYTVNQSGTRTYVDSLVASFGLQPDSITIDTCKVVIEFTGMTSDRERIYYVSVVPDSTTAVAGVHYAPISREQKFRPDKLTDTLRIVIFRENLSKDYASPVTIRLNLKLESSEDFDLGLERGLRKKILLNNYMTEPGWWKKNFDTSLGFFHPKKWQYLITLDKRFATYGNCPFTKTDNKGRSFIKSLDWYLYKNVVIDDKTGLRVKMYGLEPIEQ